LIGVLIGVLVSVVAALPAWLLMWGGKNSAMKDRLKLWAIGLGIRFVIIGGSLYYLFSQTAVPRVATVIGVAAAYIILYIVETILTLRG
jgi:hypothetical protein